MPQPAAFWKFSTQVNTTDVGTTFNDQYRPEIVSTGNGYTVIWHDNANSGSEAFSVSRVKAQRYDLLGNKIGGEIVVSTNNVLRGDDTPAEYYFANSIGTVGLPGGGFVVAYEVPDLGGADVKLVWFNSQGQKLSTVAVNLVDGFASDFALTLNSSGNVLMTYQHTDTEDFDQSVRCLEVQNNGVVGSQFIVHEGEPFEQPLGSAALSSGKTAVLWRSATHNVVTIDEYVYLGFHLVNSHGEPDGSNIVSFDEEEPGNIREAEIIQLSGGGFVVAWEQIHSGTGWDVGIAVYENSGMLRHKSIVATSGTILGTQVLHDVVALKDGGFMLAWRDVPTGISYAQNFSSSGVALGSPANIGTNVHNAKLTLLADGRVAIAFDRATSGSPYFENNIDVRTYIIDPRDFDISGTRGNDHLTSRPDGGQVSGLSGNDFIYGRGGVDILNGGSGADVISGGDSGDFIGGGSGDDILDGGDGTDFISGNENNDFITGGDGDDSLFGGSGEDQLLGGTGADVMDGGSGNDRYSVDDSDDSVTENANAGFDTVSSTISYVLGLNVEDLVLVGTATINGVGNSLSNEITGNGAANVLFGGAGFDTINGFGGNDTISGGAHADILDGGSGFDTLDYGLSASSVIVDLQTNSASDGEAAGDTISDFEAVFGSAFNDTLGGDSASNRLKGRAGRDTLTGNGGADVFDFDAASDSTNIGGESDVILDFDSNDHVDLSSIDANTVSGGDQAFTFIGDAGFTALGQVRVNQGAANTIITVNLTGNADAEMRVVLQGLHTLNVNDFIL